jgi:hypothetical protein
VLNPFFKTRNIGVKLSNPVLEQRMTWSFGWFNDWFSNGDLSARAATSPLAV